VLAFAAPCVEVPCPCDDLPGFSTAVAMGRAAHEHGISPRASLGAIRRWGLADNDFPRLKSAQPAALGRAVEWSGGLTGAPPPGRTAEGTVPEARLFGVLDGGEVSSIVDRAVRARVAASQEDAAGLTRHATALIREILPSLDASAAAELVQQAVLSSAPGLMRPPPRGAM